MNLRSGTVVGAHILRPEHRPAFEEGIRQIFLRWTALCLAVENSWGGASSKEKAEGLKQEVLDWFYKKKEHYADELEELLDDAILHDFNVEAEDGSPRQVAEALVSIYKECFEGDYSAVQRMQANAANGAAKSKRQVVDNDGTVMGEDSGGDSSSDDDELDNDEEMEDVTITGATGTGAVPMESSRPMGPVVDEEGFTVVQRRGKR
ncbi:hypothetical protein CEUSTIGMA_g10931.t1 [Chlamydomonas eustigma]|uniref:Pre-rRNA-processing protein TSR2 homolog n=1 Tax=Chlamydomonas eustigma TaxID=1157962 RepID=A0A250XKF7_9CHLO|nr:hypothetical protein CEUSTIGMA_g10931.t1 [Chlamydomonas eustigma]|eukprot:GAX83506.1 hypothetical protein CEUSTIGMA_g10931.t1 [Chlamydomonas eustigma]